MIHYKFKNCLQHDIIAFDGLNISVADLRKAIMADKKIGKASDFILQLTNAQTKEVYDKDDILIPRNTSVIVARLPLSPGKKIKRVKPDLPLPIHNDGSRKIRFDRICKKADLANADVTEGDKVQQMITQSTAEYDPSKFLKSRNMTGPVPATYICFHCGVSGHWNTNCPVNNSEVKRSKGIPQSFMVFVDGPQHKGALLTNSGKFAVPRVNMQAYEVVKKEKKPFVPEEVVPEPKVKIPEELMCNICKDILQEAVLIPCCGGSFCDECIRHILLESDNHKCPDCNTTDISPNTLIPNRFLRTAVWKYKNKGHLQKNNSSLNKFSYEFPLYFSSLNSKSNLHAKSDLIHNDEPPFVNGKSREQPSAPLIDKPAQKLELVANVFQSMSGDTDKAEVFSNNAEVHSFESSVVLSKQQNGSLPFNSVHRCDESADWKTHIKPQLASNVKNCKYSNKSSAASSEVAIQHKDVILKSVVKCEKSTYLDAKEKCVFHSTEDKNSSKQSIDSKRSSRVHDRSNCNHKTKRVYEHGDLKSEGKRKSCRHREKCSGKNIYDSDTYRDIKRQKRQLKKNFSSENERKTVSSKLYSSPRSHKKHSQNIDKYPIKNSVTSSVKSENNSPDVYLSKSAGNGSHHEQKRQTSRHKKHKRCKHKSKKYH